MPKYRIVVKEIVRHEFYVEADDVQEAEELFDDALCNDELDFTNGETRSIEVDAIYECEEEEEIYG